MPDGLSSDLVAPRTLDWTIPDRLFADAETAFHHHMGLARASPRQFYAPTAGSGTLLTEKYAILSSPEAGQYLICTIDANAAVEEFAEVILGKTVMAARSFSPQLPPELTYALEPDWLLLTPPEWRVVAACVCFPTRWSLVGKASEKLANIHEVVPRLQEELGRKIETFFDKVKPGEGWERANWGLSSNARLNQHPSLPYGPLREDHPLEGIQLRVEHQHLCKLPRTGAMSFGIRVLNYPLAEILPRPSLVIGLKRKLQTMSAEVARYKGIPPELWRRL